MIQKEKVLHDKEKNKDYLDKEINIPVKGNFENIKEISDVHCNNQCNEQLYLLDLSEFEKFADNKVNNENNNYIFGEIYSLDDLDKGNFEALQSKYNNQWGEQSYDNSLFEDFNQYCDKELNNVNSDNDHNLGFERNSQNIIILNVNNSNDPKKLDDFCKIEMGNFQKVEDCLNKESYQKLIFKNNFLLEYEQKLCDKENIG